MFVNGPFLNRNAIDSGTFDKIDFIVWEQQMFILGCKFLLLFFARLEVN